MEISGRNFLVGNHATPRQLQILKAMAALSKGTTKPVRYEDIVVKAFEMFPRDFQLRGHPKYPDSSDIHKPLYNPLREKGFVRKADNKTFALTKAGLEEVRGQQQHPEAASGQRLSRPQLGDLDRILKSDAFKLFLVNKKDEIVDSDLYRYLGATVRAPRKEFRAKFDQVSSMVELVTHEDAGIDPANIKGLHNFLTSRFADTLKYHLQPSEASK